MQLLTPSQHILEELLLALLQRLDILLSLLLERIKEELELSYGALRLSNRNPKIAAVLIQFRVWILPLRLILTYGYLTQV